MIKIILYGPIIHYKLIRRLLGQNIYSTSAYYIDGLLIDTGFQHIAQDFFDTLRSKPVEQIVHTHAHEDHIGANFLFQNQLGIKAKAHVLAVERISQPPSRLKFYRRVVWGLPNSAVTSPIEKHISTNQFSFEVIKLPGHSEDHIGFYEPNEGWFFGGDLFLSVKVKVLKYDENIYDWMDSLKKVVELPMNSYFCSSGKVLTKPNNLLKLKLEYFEETKYKTLKLHRQGWLPSKIRDEVLGKEKTLTYLSQKEFSKLNLVKALIGQRSTKTKNNS